MRKNNAKINIKKYTEEWLKEKDKLYSYEIILNNVRKKNIIQTLKKFKTDNILEIGCGLEPLFLYFDSFKSYCIVEASEFFCENAIKSIEKLDKNKDIEVIKGRIEDVYKNLGTYDFIIISSLLHEIPEPEEILKAVYEICNYNTILHVNVPNVYSLHNLIGYEIGIIKDLFEQSETGRRFGRHMRFDKNRLIKILENNGFKVIEFGSYFIKPFTNKQMEQLLEYKIINNKIIEGLEKIIKYFPDFGAEIYANAKKR